MVTKYMTYLYNITLISARVSVSVKPIRDYSIGNYSIYILCLFVEFFLSPNLRPISSYSIFYKLLSLQVFNDVFLEISDVNFFKTHYSSYYIIYYTRTVYRVRYIFCSWSIIWIIIFRGRDLSYRYGGYYRYLSI